MPSIGRRRRLIRESQVDQRKTIKSFLEKNYSHQLPNDILQRVMELSDLMVLGPCSVVITCHRLYRNLKQGKATTPTDALAHYVALNALFGKHICESTTPTWDLWSACSKSDLMPRLQVQRGRMPGLPWEQMSALSQEARVKKTRTRHVTATQAETAQTAAAEEVNDVQVKQEEAPKAVAEDQVNTHATFARPAEAHAEALCTPPTYLKQQNDEIVRKCLPRGEELSEEAYNKLQQRIAYRERLKLEVDVHEAFMTQMRKIIKETDQDAGRKLQRLNDVLEIVGLFRKD